MTATPGPLPQARGVSPHVRTAGDHVYVSGTSARRVDDSIEGAEVAEDGAVHLDAAVQSRAVLVNVERALATVGLDRADLVDATAFLVDMGDFDAWADALELLRGDFLYLPRRATKRRRRPRLRHGQLRLRFRD